MPTPEAPGSGKRFGSYCLLCLRKGGGHLCTCLHDVLNFVLAALAVLLIYLLLRDELTVPDFLRARIERELAAIGLEARFESASFDPTGRVLLQGVRLEPARFGEPILEAGLLFVELDALRLATGRVVPVHIDAQNVRAICPAAVSPSGVAETLLRVSSARLVQRDGIWTLQGLVADCGGVHVSARGTLRTPARSAPRRPPDPDELLQQFAEFAPRIVRSFEMLRGFDEPHLDLSVEAATGGVAGLDMRFSARAWSDPRIARAEGIQAGTRVEVSTDPRPRPITLSARIDSLTREGLGTAERLDAVAFWPGLPAKGKLHPERVDVAAHRIVHEKGSVENLIALVRPATFPRIEAEAWLHLEGTPISLRVAGDVQTRAGEIWVQTHFGRDWLPRASVALGRDVTYYATITTPPDVTAHVSVDAGGKWRQVEFRALAGSIIARGVPLDRARVRGVVTPAGVRIDHLEISRGDEHAIGTYSDVLATRDNRLLLRGRMRPLSISRWFGPWWGRFWSDYRLVGPPPAFDIDMHGNWKAGWKNNVRGIADAEQIIIKGIPCNALRGRFFIRPTYYDLYDATIVRPEGRVDGEVQLFYLPGSRNPRRETFTFTSTADLVELARIFGQGGEELLAPYRYDIPPRVTVSGSVENDDGRWDTRLELGIETPHAFRYKDFPLESLSTDVRIHNTHVELPRVRAGYARGLATGTALVDSGRITFDASLVNADYDLAVETYTAFLERNFPDPPELQVEEGSGSLAGRKLGGVLNLSVAANGPLTDFKAYEGKGQASLTGADLYQLKVIGIFGDLFEAMGLKIGTLEFQNATSPIEVRRDRFVFPDLRISGKTARLEASGEYSLRDRNIDFRVRLKPLRETKGFLTQIVGIVINPLTDLLFEARLTGTLRNPKRSVAFLAAKRSEVPEETPAPGAEPGAPTAIGTAPAASTPPAAPENGSTAPAPANPPAPPP